MDVCFAHEFTHDSSTNKCTDEREDYYNCVYQGKEVRHCFFPPPPNRRPHSPDRSNLVFTISHHPPPFPFPRLFPPPPTPHSMYTAAPHTPSPTTIQQRFMHIYGVEHSGEKGERQWVKFANNWDRMHYDQDQGMRLRARRLLFPSHPPPPPNFLPPHYCDHLTLTPLTHRRHLGACSERPEDVQGEGPYRAEMVG